MPYPGKKMVAVGTDFGVFVSEADNPRGWTKVSIHSASRREMSITDTS
jgi:hypothetical protein